MDPQETGRFTRLLIDWRDGDAAALDALTPLVYDELRRVAQGHLRSERADHTLQATALVHEAFVRLVDAQVDWQDRAHFFALAARLMRRVLVDHAKAKRRDKRGGGHRPVSLEQVGDVGAVVASDADGVIELDRALEALAGFDARKMKAIELLYFGGLTYREIAEVLEVSEVTVHRDLKLAKAWLRNAIEGEASS